MDQNLVYILAFFGFINLVAFFIMLADKAKSRDKESDRIPEGVLFFMAAAFGSAGVYVGMITFRHKTRKWYFILGIPLLFFENMACLYLVYLILNGKLYIL